MLAIKTEVEMNKINSAKNSLPVGIEPMTSSLLLSFLDLGDLAKINM